MPRPLYPRPRRRGAPLPSRAVLEPDTGHRIRTKIRKLPALSASLTPVRPPDDPARHQGRVRTAPHVEGQFAAYVYVPLRLEKGAPLARLLRDVLESAKARVPSLHPISIQLPPGESELHISLTRPVYLRAHQRDELKTAVRAIARAHSAFTASFAAFAELTNDERTRTFLAVEAGAGHAELKALSDALVPTLRLLRQKEFYSAPRFHASIAWALLDRATPGVDLPPSSSATDTLVLNSPPPDDATARFPTIPHFPETLVQDLNKQFGGRLVSRQTGAFQIDEVCVRIGKEVTAFKLR
ncbi:hypothetical protein CERSUDRAFT_45798 [Gelatoporia subvermispora B]|uniref:U6 snRNA phosphodiesterase 1 n=1 Tax=Ceriporiopsis subvermispora (strain B) TaxID=914234 RepID=M2PSQ1_CERS8|nr:hypothetical protein CERSUDRAFT_45798 [Gelatoporia subvermispora B]